MSEPKRPSAQDLLAKSRPVFAKKMTFVEAFPSVESVFVEVTETGEGVRGKSCLTYTEKTLGQYVGCSNPLCYGGGISIGNVLRQMVAKEETERVDANHCIGREGSPKGKVIYRDCMNFFKYRIEVRYR